MPTKKLDDRTITHLKAPKSGRVELWDSMLPGFGLRVTEKDARTWFVMYRSGAGEDRKQRRLKIGDAKLMSLTARAVRDMCGGVSAMWLYRRRRHNEVAGAAA